MPRSLKTEGATGHQHPCVGFSFDKRGTRSPGLGWYKNLLDGPAIMISNLVMQQHNVYAYTESGEISELETMLAVRVHTLKS